MLWALGMISCQQELRYPAEADAVSQVLAEVANLRCAGEPATLDGRQGMCGLTMKSNSSR